MPFGKENDQKSDDIWTASYSTRKSTGPIRHAWTGFAKSAAWAMRDEGVVVVLKKHSTINQRTLVRAIQDRIYKS